MMTTYSQFDTDYTPKNGEKANHTVLSRPSLQLKKEVVSLNSQVNAILGNIYDWDNSSAYSEGEIIRYSDGKVYISLQDGNVNNIPPNTLNTWWDVQDALTEGIGSDSGGDVSGGTAFTKEDSIRVRRDTSSNWSSVNPQLEAGEIGFETNTGKFKIGNGSTSYNSLPIANPDEIKEIPNQSGNSGKYLTTNGTSVSWGTVATGGTTVNVASTSANLSYYPLFFTSTDGTLSTANTNNGLNYVPYSGVFSSTQFNATSDEKSKKNVTPISGATDIINKIAGVEFDWKHSNKHSSGVIAQELEEVLPFLVDTDNNGLKSVNYNGIIGYLIECNKELAARVSKLEVE